MNIPKSKCGVSPNLRPSVSITMLQIRPLDQLGHLEPV